MAQEENFKNTPSRRDFMRTTAVISGGFMILPSRVLGREENESPNEKLNIAAIGAGGRGRHNLNRLDGENIVALCDVDDEQAAKSYNKFENVPKYKDFRVMLDKHNDIDAVVVSTPDHTHAVSAMNAIQRGKHVYVEKPLAHNINEVRALMKAAKENKVQTQLGNQGHSYNDIRRICEWVWQGAIGHVHEVHAWFERPYGDGSPPPKETPEVPKTLDWDLWLGPAMERPYHPTYLPGSWRHWDDFGTGVLGDWVCHILDPTFWALQLGAPTSIVAHNGGKAYSPERFPLQSTIEYQFPARTVMPAVKVTWTYGKEANIPQLRDADLDDWNKRAGAILIGEKGCIVHGSHGGGGAQLIPDSRAMRFSRTQEHLPRIEGGHHQEWIRACKEGTPADSNFTYGGPLTEIALLGVIATKLDGEKLEWDGENAKFKNNGKANEFVVREYRKGWML